jgi:F-type H+-transporting ATPase subunit delta
MGVIVKLSNEKLSAFSLRLFRSNAKSDNQAVGTQYARALLDTAESTGDLESVHSDINTLSSLINDNPALCDIMVNASVPIDKKFALIETVTTEGSFKKYTKNFLKLLIEKGRIDCIVELIEAFEDLYCQATNTQVALVKSAIALEEEQQFLLARKIQELTNSKSVKIKPIIDESLIGGFIVEYGSSQVDLSIRGAFERVKKEITTMSI